MLSSIALLFISFRLDLLAFGSRIFTQTIRARLQTLPGHLDEPVDVPHLDLAEAGQSADWGVGTDVDAYGYGAECVDCAPTLELERANMAITSLRENTYTMFASGGGADGHTVCTGDNGGPLIAPTEDGPKLVGIMRDFPSRPDPECDPGFG